MPVRSGVIGAWGSRLDCFCCPFSTFVGDDSFHALTNNNGGMYLIIKDFRAGQARQPAAIGVLAKPFDQVRGRQIRVGTGGGQQIAQQTCPWLLNRGEAVHFADVGSN